ncbi:M20/M25/M40 family metallo-hydrolase, partial [Steroidobacter sp.]|uniref:M20/M25/M40 family metallo-hydrolase n=1 Tax=Steroidobacter sp. TaxID=1978227 RepID=UPI001A3829BB
ASEGALAWVSEAWRDGGRVHGDGYLYKVGESPKLPGVEMAAEDYRKLARFAKTDTPPTLEILSRVRYHDDDTKAYNIIADLPGRDRKAGYVMAGAHLDSWVASDGAQDNAAGSVVVMEAARILKKLQLKPKRTIRFVLWNGEEQGMLGSKDYVEKHFATRAPLADPEQANIEPFYTWRLRYPVTKSQGYGDLAGYFNLDNGSGKVRGIYAEGNFAAVPIFKEWLAPFASMGATQVAVKRTGGTDHVFMQDIGLPGFQFIQDPLDYSSRTHHSDVDSYDHLKMPDLKQATVILASMLLMAAERDEPLPRLPVPNAPQATDPFEYRDEGS